MKRYWHTQHNSVKESKIPLEVLFNDDINAIKDEEHINNAKPKLITFNIYQLGDQESVRYEVEGGGAVIETTFIRKNEEDFLNFIRQFNENEADAKSKRTKATNEKVSMRNRRISKHSNHLNGSRLRHNSTFRSPGFNKSTMRPKTKITRMNINSRMSGILQSIDSANSIDSSSNESIKKRPMNIKLVTPHLGLKTQFAFDAQKVSLSSQKMNSTIVASKFQSKEHKAKKSIRLTAIESEDLSPKKISTRRITNFRQMKVMSQAPSLQSSRKMTIPGSLNDRINKSPIYKPQVFSDGSSSASSSSSSHIKGDIQNLKVPEISVQKQMIMTAKSRRERFGNKSGLGMLSKIKSQVVNSRDNERQISNGSSLGMASDARPKLTKKQSNFAFINTI
jgi:hypothetical protein